MFPEFLLQDVAPEGNALVALFRLDPGLDLRDGPGRDGVLEPVLAGVAARLGDDLDRVAAA